MMSSPAVVQITVHSPDVREILEETLDTPADLDTPAHGDLSATISPARERLANLVLTRHPDLVAPMTHALREGAIALAVDTLKLRAVSALNAALDAGIVHILADDVAPCLHLVVTPLGRRALARQERIIHAIHKAAAASMAPNSTPAPMFPAPRESDTSHVASRLPASAAPAPRESDTSHTASTAPSGVTVVLFVAV